jgi:hypothetical protein
MVFENKVLEKIPEPDTEELTGNEETYIMRSFLIYSPDQTLELLVGKLYYGAVIS